MNNRISNAYIQCGRIANPTEQVANPTEQEVTKLATKLNLPLMRICNPHAVNISIYNAQNNISKG